MKNSTLLKFVYVFFSFFTIDSMLSAKVLLFTFAHSRPDFIELHAKTFKAFLQDEYEYVVFNDAPNDDMVRKVVATCAKLSVRCFRVPQNLHNGRQTPNYRHADGIKYALELLGFDFDGIVVLVDSDMFLISPLSIEKYMEGYDFIGGYQTRANDKIEVLYTSPCLTFMDMRTLPNKRTLSYEPGTIEGLHCDVGAHTYYYFKNNQSLRIRFYTAVSKQTLPRDETSLRQLGYDDHLIKFLSTVNFMAITIFFITMLVDRTGQGILHNGLKKKIAHSIC